MHVTVISIGNSKWIRLNKINLKKYNITDRVEVILEKEYIIIKPKSTPREGWDKVFKKMHDQSDDGLVIPDIFKDEKLEEWS